MKKLYALFLLIAGTFSSIIFVPRMLELTSTADYIYTTLGILTAVILFFLVFKWLRPNKEKQISSDE